MKTPGRLAGARQ
ncbi:hypothetical protein E2C01_101546 [Portunus trituberculatus]|uniref:Uncharacterized protein n=1 Tax=Portunus trituberculatus TaxID=210409 RepID=A0A5B7K9W2_PORTR|nr:hypothetical protein [Portunus trituberculatus]